MAANVGAPRRVPYSSRTFYRDFSGGDYGQLGGRKPPANSFRAMNMIVTADGELCPRPGWRDRSPSNMPVGKVVGLVPTQTPTRDMLFIVGNTVYAYDLALAPTPGATAASMGTLGTTPTLALHPKIGTTEFYVTVPGDKTYKLDPVGNTVTGLTGSPGGVEVEVYGERLIVASSTNNQIFFSDPDNFNSWPAENFIGVPGKWGVTSLREQSNHLAMFKSRGKFGLTGVPGVNPVDRKVERSLGVLHPGQLTIDEEDRIWFIPAFHTNPASFNGSQTEHVHYLKEFSSSRDGDTPALPLVLGVTESIGDMSPSTVLFVQGGTNKMLLNHNGIWTRHTTSMSISGMVRGGYTADFYITDGGSAGAAGKIYSNQFTANRPAFTTDGLFRPGDDSDTPVDAWVTFPQFWTEDGYVVRVRDVVVEFEKFNTGASATNHFEISVQTLGRLPVGQSTASAVTYAWSEAGSGAGASIGNSQRDIVNHGFNVPRGNGFEISLNGVRGVKIHAVTVVYDRWPETGTNP